MCKIVKNIFQDYEEDFNTKIGGFIGFGDFIRGSINLYFLCKELSTDFEIDYSKNQIGKFLKNERSKTLSIFKDENVIFFSQVKYEECKNYINETNKDILYVMTNLDRPINFIDEECKRFFKESLIPNHILEKSLTDIFNKFELFPREYNIIHLRLGDNKLISNEDISFKYKKIFEKIKKLTNNFEDKKYFLISDDKDIKNYFNNDKVVYHDFEPCHLGNNKYDEEKTLTTLLDFFIMSKTKKIITHSEYSWISGFSYWCSRIYDIEIIS